METTNLNTNGNRVAGADYNRALSVAGLSYPVHGNGENYASRHSGRAWEVKYDVSAGWEITTPALELDENGHSEELRKGCEAISSLRPKISSGCGLHVHVDCSDFNWKQVQKLVALWARYEPFFFSLVPTSRQGNQYLPKLRGYDWNDAYNADARRSYRCRGALEATTKSDFRYETENALGKYNTLRTNIWWSTGRVEFRLHSGTVSYDKIRRWVTLVTSLVGRVATSGITTGRLAKTVRPLARPTGFGPAYVLGALGLGPGGQGNAEGEAQTLEVYEDLLAWIPQRQSRFHRRVR